MPTYNAWNWKWKSLSQVRSVESGMEEFESNFDAWNQEWRSSSQVLNLESEMEEFERS